MFVLAMTMLAATPDFLTEFAETRRYQAGRPVAPTVTPDGSAVLFLRSAAKDVRQTLFEFTLSTGETREVLTPDSILKGAAETLSVEERARLERMRVSSRGFNRFRLSPDGAKVLVTLSGKLYVLTRATGAVQALAVGEGAAIDATFAPDGASVVYARGYDVYAVDLAKNVERRLTTGGTEVKPHGQAEFVAQEEMSRFSGFWLSPDAKLLAFQETDHSGMERFAVPDPMHPEAEAPRFFYPRAGKQNAVVRLGITSTSSFKPTWIQWDAKAFPYVATVKWPKAGKLSVLVQSRDQRQSQLLAVDPKSGATTVLLREEDSAWLNIVQDVPRWLPDGSGFFWSTERNGAPELELRGSDGALRTSWVKPEAGFSGERGLVGYSASTKTLYFTGGTDPTQSLLFSSREGAAPQRVKTPSADKAIESVEASDDASVFVVTSSSLDAMPRSFVIRATGEVVGELPSVAQEPSLELHTDIHQLSAEPKSWAQIIRPERFTKGKKYPVILNVYGGPGHLEVLQHKGPNLVLQWLANQGFIVVKLDGRGTPRRGRSWERAISHDFATTPAADQLAGLKALAAEVPEMDLTRVGVYGWSFGGYMAALLTLRHGDALKYGVAGAPVVDWLDYDTHYTERYLGLPADAPEAYAEGALHTNVAAAKRGLLLIHGTADDNVYFLHTLKLSEALFRAGKSHDVLPLSNFTHMVPEPVVTKRLWERIARAFTENL